MKDRKLLMIPGPVEFDPAVLAALGAPTTSHVAPEFIEVFGQALERMRDVFLSPDGQPFIIAGSGTLAMDLAGANLVEPGDKALVVNTGHFGDRYGALLERYGAEITYVRAPIGDGRRHPGRFVSDDWRARNRVGGVRLRLREGRGRRGSDGRALSTDLTDLNGFFSTFNL